MAVWYCLIFFFFTFLFFLFIATTHTDNTTLHDYLSYASITTLRYTANLLTEIVLTLLLFF